MGGRDGSHIFVVSHDSGTGGNLISAARAHTGEIAWQKPLDTESGSSASSDTSSTLSKSAWIRKKRYAVIGALLLVLALRRSGWAQRPKKKDSEEGVNDGIL